MNTREFSIKQISHERMNQLHNRVEELDKEEKMDVKKDVQDKFTCWTHWKDKRPQFKYYEYKSGTKYLHDFRNQVNYQYIPA